MKLKNMWKRFWTLDVHNHEGFTLVELIIVIAILAILSTGAIAGYSAYVEKANKTADKALASEIKNVLMLHYYSEEVPYVWVILSDNGAETSDTNVLTAAYGNLGSLKLKAQWANNGTLVASLRQGINGAQNYNNSYFAQTSTSELLDQVALVTTSASEFLTVLPGEAQFEMVLNNMYGGSLEAMKTACNQFGIKYKNLGDGKYAFDDSVSEKQITNLLVMGTANDISTAENGDPSEVTMMAAQYAAFVAFAGRYSDDAGIQTAYNEMNRKLKEEYDPTALNWFLNQDAVKAKWENYTNPADPDVDTRYAEDMAAFAGVMDALHSVSGTVTAEDMANSDFFTSEKISNMFNGYVNTAAVLAGIPETDIAKMQAAVNAGQIVILMAADGTVLCTSLELMQ